MAYAFAEDFAPDFRWSLLDQPSERALRQLLAETHHLIWPLIDPADRERLIGTDKRFLVSGVAMAFRSQEEKFELTGVPPPHMSHEEFYEYCLRLSQPGEQSETVDTSIARLACATGAQALAAISLNVNNENEQLPLLFVPEFFATVLPAQELPEDQKSVFAVNLTKQVMHQALTAQ